MMNDQDTAVPSSSTTTTTTTTNLSNDVGVQTIFQEEEDSQVTLLSNKLDPTEENESTDSSSSSYSINSNTSTRRSSLQSCDFSSGLATPLQFLFQSTSSSNLDSPTIPNFKQEADVLNGLDQLLRRITSERFLELRRIQLGERPVTSGNARSSIEHFFDRAINGPTVQERTEEEAQNRPQNVANDVESLLQLSRVSSAIQNGFRSRLEATLTGRSSQTTTNPPPTRNTRNRQQLPSLNRLPVTRQQQQSVIPPPPPPPPSISQQSSNLQRSVEQSVQLLTESIATDITRLQSLQVVSNLLQDDFRHELENLVQQRVENFGGNQTATPRRLFPTTHQRLASINRTPPRLRTINEQRSGGASSNINQADDLRREMNEMKQMLRMTMEIQLDTQRSIRQEVSSIFNTFMTEYLASHPQVSGQHNFNQLHQQQQLAQSISTIQQNSNTTTPMERGKCIICVDQAVDTVFYQCGHMCTCHSCAIHLKVGSKACPMCRAPIRDVIKTYCQTDDQ